MKNHQGKMERFALILFVVILMNILLISCGQEEEVETDFPESEIIEESETVPESESEWTPISMEDKLHWIDEIWPEWEAYAWGTGNYTGIPRLDYYQKWIWPTQENQNPSASQEVGKVMYSTKRQLVYEYIMIPEAVSPLDPYYGTVVGVLEKGEPVYVTEIRYNHYRPEEGVYYRIDETVGTPFFDTYCEEIQHIRNQSDRHQIDFGEVLYLSEIPPEKDDVTEELPVWEAKEPAEWEEKEWMDDVWPEWEKWVDWDMFHEPREWEWPEPFCGFSITYCLPVGYGTFVKEYYSESWTYDSIHEWVRENYYGLFLDSATYIQTERTNRIMYATENQLVYYKIVAEPDLPLKEPYCGFVVGALEKGDAVRVVSVVENQQNPDDPVFYGIAYEPSLGTAPFMDSYIGPFKEYFYEGNSGQTAFGFASKLSETPPTE